MEECGDVTGEILKKKLMLEPGICLLVAMLRKNFFVSLSFARKIMSAGSLKYKIVSKRKDWERRKWLGTITTALYYLTAHIDFSD